MTTTTTKKKLRRKYRFRSRAEAEDAVRTAETEHLHQLRLARALHAGTVQWGSRYGAYRSGWFDLSSPAGPRIVIEFAPEDQDADLTVYRADDPKALPTLGAWSQDIENLHNATTQAVRAVLNYEKTGLRENGVARKRGCAKTGPRENGSARTTKLKKITIKAPIRSGDLVDCVGYQVAPGIGVVKCDGDWSVTHLATGTNCTGIYFDRRKDAVAMARVLIQEFTTIDWPGSSKALVTKMRAHCETHFPGIRTREVMELLQDRAEALAETVNDLPQQ